MGNSSISAQAMRELFDRETPVCWFSFGGWFSGIAEGLPGKHVGLRRAQHVTASDTLLAVARNMVSGKIRNSRTLLRRNSRVDQDDSVARLLALAKSTEEAASYATLLGLEGAAARSYFSGFTSMLQAPSGVDVGLFDVHGRSRRPPPDPVNALLSFAYALLVKDLTAIVYSIGFDPYVGVYHRPRYGRPALALDLAEEFRPLIADSTVVQLINNGEIRPNDYRIRAGACQLERSGRRALISAYERRLAHEIKHPVFGYRVNYRRALDVQARILASHLTGELPSYTPFTTR